MVACLCFARRVLCADMFGAVSCTAQALAMALIDEYSGEGRGQLYRHEAPPPAASLAPSALPFSSHPPRTKHCSVRPAGTGGSAKNRAALSQRRRGRPYDATVARGGEPCYARYPRLP